MSTSDHLNDSALVALDIAASALRYESLSDLTTILRDLGQATDSFAVLLWELVPGVDPRQRSEPGQLFVLADWLKNQNRYASHNLPLNSLTGMAITSNQTLICTDVKSDPRVYHGPPDFFGAYNIQSFVTIPVHFGDSEFGALNLYRNFDSPFSDLSIAVGETFVRLLPRIYSGLREKGSLKLIGTLNSLVQKYEGDPNRLQLSTAKKALQEIATTISRGFRCLEASIYLVQTATEPDKIRKVRFEATTFEPFVRRNEYQVGDEGLTGWILKSRQPLRIPDLKCYDRDKLLIETKYPGLTGYKLGRLIELLRDKLAITESALPPVSFIAVPILFGDELLGVIRCCAPLQAPYYYTEPDERLLALVASQIGHFWRNWVEAGAIQNENRSWMSLVAALNQLIREGSSQEKLNEDQILKQFLQVARAVIPEADILDVRLVDTKKKWLYFATMEGAAWNSEYANKRFHLDAISAGVWTFKNNKTRIMQNVEDDEFYDQTFPDVNSMVIAPISSGSEEYGVLDVRITSDVGIPPNTPAIAEALGRQLGLYLHLSRTLRKVSDVEKKLKRNIVQLKQSQKDKEEVLEIQRRVFEDLEHQLKLPVLQAHARLSAVLSKTLSGDKIISSMNATRGLLRKAERVVRGMGIFVALARGEKLKGQFSSLKKDPLIKLLIEICMDCIFLEGHHSRGLHFQVHDRTFDILDSLDVKCDRDLLEQAIYDIVDNACKYSSNKEEIQVRGGVDSRRKFFIAVVNRGIAISPEDVPHVIERGWRGRKAFLSTGQGSGIGCWFAHHVMVAHGGQLKIFPTNSEGFTEVRLQFG